MPKVKPTMENINELDREITWIKEVLREHEIHIKSIKKTLNDQGIAPRNLSNFNLNNLSGNSRNRSLSRNSLSTISNTNSPRTLTRKKNKLHSIFSINPNNSPNTRTSKIKQGWNKYTSQKGLRSLAKLMLPNSPYVPNSPRAFKPYSPMYVP